jgi:hypothetical protein
MARRPNKGGFLGIFRYLASLRSVAQHLQFSLVRRPRMGLGVNDEEERFSKNRRNRWRSWETTSLDNGLGILGASYLNIFDFSAIG